MSNNPTKSSGNYHVHIVTSRAQYTGLSENDKKMDIRATQAVTSALVKARICNKPIAKYDVSTQKAYIEYSNGEKKYVE